MRLYLDGLVRLQEAVVDCSMTAPPNVKVNLLEWGGVKMCFGEGLEGIKFVKQKKATFLIIIQKPLFIKQYTYVQIGHSLK